MNETSVSPQDGKAQVHLSVAMCTWNGARYLSEQLRSIAEQSLLPGELIVCDDGSSDETLAILENFARIAPFPVRVFMNERNLGPAKNFEKAIQLCRGELIALSDQDDIWYPQKLSILARILGEDATLGGVFSDGTLIDDSSAPVRGRLWQRVRYRPPSDSLHVESSLAACLLKRNVVTGAALMIRASVRDIILPVPDPWLHDGWIAWMLVLHSGVAAVPEPLIGYRVHRAQHAGLSPGSLPQRIAAARRARRNECLPTATQFEVLRAHLARQPQGRFEELQASAYDKINHLRRRAHLPQTLLPRVLQVLAARNEYRLYSNGLSTMLKDIFLA